MSLIGIRGSRCVWWWAGGRTSLKNQKFFVLYWKKLFDPPPVCISVGPPGILRSSQGFGGTGEQDHLLQGTGEQMPFFQGNRGTSSEIWGTGEHNILRANDIKYCYKEAFLGETQKIEI